MSRKHFEALARALAQAAIAARQGTGHLGAAYGAAVAAIKVADVCAQENPRFDRQRFIARIDEHVNVVTGRFDDHYVAEIDRHFGGA